MTRNSVYSITLATLLVASTAFFSACSPTAPSSATVVAISVVRPTNPLFFNGDQIIFTLQNAGPGCASNIRGVINLHDTRGNAPGGAVNFVVPISLLPNKISLRPKEIVVAMSDPIPEINIVALVPALTDIVPSWDNARCP
jgi:hypothetical protein